MCAYSVFNTFPVYPLSAKPLILLAFCRYRYHTSLFERPSWTELIEKVENGEVSALIVKDMSRLGRDYLKVGFYTEVLFVEKGVRFIAINNGIDSANQTDSDFTPFLNIIKNISHSGKVSNDFSLFRRFCCINRCFRCSCGKFAIVHGE